MQPIKTKAQIRAELAADVAQYLVQGGEVADIPRGVSGFRDNTNPYSFQSESAPRQERTPLNDVMRTLDARKRGKLSVYKPKPKKKLITDDFGEPLRWVWVQDD
ncbi:MAG TPA: hypothetical protein PKD17_05440 [Cellvibrionaceae bacterium]|nr:hypothetical protein [Cellvibrionaceae bacterium]HNG61219.1 hypothetical protein [Cellvibrionaceae bacterium]